MAFHELMRARRRQLKISQEGLASMVGTSQNQISRYENGENDPTSDMIVKIAKALKTTPNWLLGFDGLTPEELYLLDLYRAKNPESKHKLVDIARVV